MLSAAILLGALKANIYISVNQKQKNEYALLGASPFLLQLTPSGRVPSPRKQTRRYKVDEKKIIKDRQNLLPHATPIRKWE